MVEMLEKVAEAARDAMKLTGHLPSCGFAGCTCGATEKFKTARLEFYRALAELDAARKITSSSSR
jgi:glutaredoxin-related protein